jgi:glycosyltransferase involved in cell wall biosynthesis
VNTWHIVTSEYPPDIGGVSDYTRQVAEGLARMGDEVHVWCPRATAGPMVAGLHVHPELGSIRPGDLRRLDVLLKPFHGPRRLLVQWVPHGFGYHSMNVWFCVWLARRAWSGDHVELMVHEPYLELRRGPLRHVVMALVHRFMTVLLLVSARKVWISIPSWERLLRPYALGRTVSMQWLPVPGCVPDEHGPSITAIRVKYLSGGRHLVGHFGSYGAAVKALLLERLPLVMNDPMRPVLLLLGAGGEQFRDALVSQHPGWTDRVHAAGYLSAADLGAHITACDVFVQPYPDGISSRRTSAMACLSRSRAVVTTRGSLTEPLWAESGAVASPDVSDVAAFASAALDLLGDNERRLALGIRGRQVYVERFSLTRVVDALRAA